MKNSYRVFATIFFALRCANAVGAQQGMSITEKIPLATIGTPTYNEKIAGVLIPFSFGKDFCRKRSGPFDVELEVENLTGKLLGIPYLVSAANAPDREKKLDGIPLGCGEYMAVWPNSSHSQSFAKDMRVRVTLFADGARVIAYSGPIRYTNLSKPH